MSRTRTRLSAATVAAASLALGAAPAAAPAAPPPGQSVVVGGTSQASARGDLGVAARIARRSAPQAERLVRRSAERLRRSHRLAIRAAQAVTPRAQAQVAISLSGSAAVQAEDLVGIVLRERGRVQRAAAAALVQAAATQADVSRRLADRLAGAPQVADAAVLHAVGRLAVEQVEVIVAVDAAAHAPALDGRTRRTLTRGLERALAQRAALERSIGAVQSGVRAELAGPADELALVARRGSERLRDLLAGSSVNASVVVDTRVGASS